MGKPPPRLPAGELWLLVGAEENLALCCVIIKPLSPSNWQLLGTTQGMVIFMGKRDDFLLSSFLYQEGFMAFAAALCKGIVWGCCW